MPGVRLIGRHAVDAAALGRLADDGVLTALVDACDAPAVPEQVLGCGPDVGACLYQGAEAVADRDLARGRGVDVPVLRPAARACLPRRLHAGRSRAVLRAGALARGAGRLFRAAHDRWGRITELAYQDGTHAAVAYHHAGAAGVLDMAGARPSAVTDRLGSTTRYAYDADGALTGLTDALGRTTRFAYGDWRRPDAVIYPGGRAERYAYDGAGGLAAITYADGVVLRVICDDARQVTALASDGHPASGGEPVVAPVRVAFVRDDAGRVTAARTGTAAGAPDGPPTAVTVAYDAAGRVVSETATLGASEDAQSAEQSAIASAYDARGALVGLTAPTGETLAYTWDADGRLAASTDWSGRRYTLDYAREDRGWRVTTPTGVAHTVLAYDAADQVAAVDDTRLGAWQYAYDAEGQLTACDGPAATETARYGYDAVGNRIAVAEGSAEAPAVDAGD